MRLVRLMFVSREACLLSLTLVSREADACVS